MQKTCFFYILLFLELHYTLLCPSYIYSFSSRRKRIDEEKGGRPKLPFLWECLSGLNGRNSLRSNKRPFLTPCHSFSLCGNAAQPVIPVTGRLGNKYKQLQIRVCWKNYENVLRISNTGCNRIHTLQLSFIIGSILQIIQLRYVFWQMYFFGDLTKSVLHDEQHRPLRACRPVEDRIRSLTMTESSGVWAKRICRAVIVKRCKAKLVLGGGFFLFWYLFLSGRTERKSTLHM